jgi:hypothetical protein
MTSGRLISIAIVVIGILTSAVIAQDTDRTVLVPVSVLGAGSAPVAGLKQEDFQLLEENKEQKIAFFSPDNSPLSIGMILGAGALVRADRISQAKNTGGRLIYAEPAGDLKDESVKLAEELKNQYVLGFTSRNDSSSGKWRNLKVNVYRAGWTTEVHVAI